MKNTLNLKVVGVAVELAEDEVRFLDYWWTWRTKPGVEIPDFERYQCGERVMIDMLKMFREGFHKDGE